MALRKLIISASFKESGWLTRFGAGNCWELGEIEATTLLFLICSSDCLLMIFILDHLQTEADDEWPLTYFWHRDLLNCSHKYKQALKARTLKCSCVSLHRRCSVDAYLCYSHARRLCISDDCLFTRTSPVASRTCCDVFPLLLTFIFAGCWPAERAASFKANYGHKIEHIKPC